MVKYFFIAGWFVGCIIQAILVHKELSWWIFQVITLLAILFIWWIIELISKRFKK